MWDALEHDADGNALEGPVVTLDSRNVLVRSDETVLTTIVGVNDVVAVCTGDAVLVTARNKTESVKSLVEQLKPQNRQEVVEHLRMYRPWGYYHATGNRYQVKRIVVKLGAMPSLQKHFHRAKHWIGVPDTAKVTLDGVEEHALQSQSVRPLQLFAMCLATLPARTPQGVP